jgi:hypothetical protein
VVLLLAGALAVSACSSDPGDEAAPAPAPAADEPADSPAEPPAPAPTEPSEEPAPPEPTPEPAPDAEPAPEPDPPPAEEIGCSSPYSSSSPWNTPIGPDPVYDRDSEMLVAGLGERLTSDPTQFTYPVYQVNAETELQELTING